MQKGRGCVHLLSDTAERAPGAVWDGTVTEKPEITLAVEITFGAFKRVAERASLANRCFYNEKNNTVAPSPNDQNDCTCTGAGALDAPLCLSYWSQPYPRRLRTDRSILPPRLGGREHLRIYPDQEEELN